MKSQVCKIRTQPAGLTLLELLIALGIGGVLVLAGSRFAFMTALQENREESAEESFEALILPLRTLKKDIEYADLITGGSATTLTLHSVRNTSSLSPNDDVISTYTILDSPCPETSTGTATCKTLSRSVSVNGAASTVTGFPGLANLEWCLTGSPFLPPCAASFSNLAPSGLLDAPVAGKRFFARISRQTSTKDFRIPLVLAIDLENVGYATIGAGHARPVLVRSP